MAGLTDALQGWLGEPLVYPVVLAFLLCALLFVVAVVTALRQGAFAWRLVGEWADAYVGPTVLLAALGLTVWAAGLGSPTDNVRLLVTGLEALYLGAVVSWDATLVAKVASHFGQPTPTPPAA